MTHHPSVNKTPSIQATQAEKKPDHATHIRPPSEAGFDAKTLQAIHDAAAHAKSFPSLAMSKTQLEFFVQQFKF